MKSAYLSLIAVAAFALAACNQANDGLTLNSPGTPSVSASAIAANSCPADKPLLGDVETITVLSKQDGAVGGILGAVGSEILASGQPYVLLASGTWTNRGSAFQGVDAEYTTQSNWIPPQLGQDGYQNGYDQTDGNLGEGFGDLQVNGAFVSWGSYDADHEYALAYTGNGSPVSLRVFDGNASPATAFGAAPGVAQDGWYGDNSGSLTVHVYSCNPVPPVEPPALSVVITKDQCMNDGWKTLTDDVGKLFKNQGDCVSFVATKGKNKAAGR
jgi:hypothetical protein